MTDLRRLLEETDSEAERALLHAGMSYRSSRETRAKTLTALGLGGSAAIVAGAASATSAAVSTTSASATAVSATLSPLAKISGVSGAKVLLALSAVGAVAAVPLGYRALHRPTEVAAVGQRATEHHLASAGSEGAAPPPALNLSVGLPGAQAGLPAPEASARSRSSVKGAAPVVSLAQELSALDGARSMLARGNAQGALFLLDGYDRSCPRGKLAIEAELLRIDALAKNGQSRDARFRAELFLKRHPSSLLASRARTYLDD